MENGLYWTRLLDLIKQNCLKRGKVPLSSGTQSHYYIDGKMVTLSPEGCWLIAQLIFELLENEHVQADAIGGLTIGADPIATAVAYLSHERGKPIHAFIVRMEQKAHGMGKLIEGPLEDNSNVVIIDDVVTRGTSIHRAIEAVQDKGCKVVKVIALVDRLEGARKRLERYDFTSIFTRDDILEKQNERTRAEVAPGPLS